MIGLTINTQLGTLNTVRNLSMMHRSVKKTMEKLSSGQRINRAADDPAGLVISEKMRAQIGSIAAEIQNLDTTLAKNRTADSALMEMETSLIEMREIAVAAASSGNVDEGMVEAYEETLNNSVNAFNRMAEDATFGKTRLFDGSEGSVAHLQELSQFDLSDPEQAEEAVSRIDEKLSELTEIHGEIGAKSAFEIQSMRDNLAVSHQNMTEAESTLRDTDMALTYSQFVSQLIRLQAGTAMLAQGNLMSQSVYGLLSG